MNMDRKTALAIVEDGKHLFGRYPWFDALYNEAQRVVTETTVVEETLIEELPYRTYEVIFTRTLEQSMLVRVQARDEDEALEFAEDDCLNGEDNWWTVNDEDFHGADSVTLIEERAPHA
jgi:hypothetical protein